MFKRILIANRGEIARRIARSCQRLGIEFVAVHSSADAGAEHLRGAVAREWIGEAPASTSYLNGQAIIDAALRSGCEAIHPGYGFLSENPGFARAVAEAGLVFIGPDADTIVQMGDKARARQLMEAAGVPVLPGSPEATESYGLILETCAEIGYPVILKPSAGGGGKGMQVVWSEAALREAVDAAVRIGRSSFGDGRLLVERYVSQPRHLEVQIFGDGRGAAVHLFERECSLQRRHQKIVEEAPACGLPADTREALLAAAVRGAQAIGYRNAGTFEFILAPDGRFYFLEVNTRLQVEHPVTEAITGQDLVEWQLRIAAGEGLPLAQADIRADGHAIECRVYAEDPLREFAPMPGAALHARWPAQLRVDAAFDHGGAVPAFYDPMLAKLIAHGASRAAALAQLQTGLRDTELLGLTSNLGFLQRLLREPRVQAGQLHTHLVDELAAAPEANRLTCAVACAAAIRLALACAESASPWQGGVGAYDRAALDPDAPLGRMAYRGGAERCQAWLLERDAERTLVQVDGRRHAVSLSGAGEHWQGEVDGWRWYALLRGDDVELSVGGQRVALRAELAEQAEQEAGGGLQVRTPMPGTVVALPLAAGSRVEAQQVVAIVEAMKMENRLYAPCAGIVAELHCQVGDIVNADALLVSLGQGEAE
ncbi:acetyl/propionyl/methylcrotonyl-CoA carboxylase subunit alpha [Chromobacterium violaceum]|uniref:acetyl/propionyl/methylcrotonyl-CoA carboxylase subunit alpha n=1 Tax=Chromobacterium violaceum TaxID=536 RepID=UPI0009DA2A2E|nr:biotin carboxylase N-terminal domain-containing protein [Chromobacterium violaceum]OQS50646.1 carbamoyl-phosphate synthase subunit L [Chromobacterium violaceum]OQS52831.1 carbamoyl-phosphate synthase subunit L [Chromobacterium violaceum]QRO31689.1 ATP-grasp domain-containing protein [Chromobacterium violaceum]QRQ18511.1 ATP-grasp domain-containing protein [Chromobacterium violaceum]